jgi:hypothetical protein
VKSIVLPLALAALTVAGSATADETATRRQLERLLATYDLEPWLFTRDILIQRGTIPHSHPVLTLSTRHLKDDDLLLATFVHEQIHWFLGTKSEASRLAKAELRELYPKVPVGYPEGAQNEDSTYLHLVVCYLEHAALRHLLGELRARQVMEFWTHDHYTWVYREVLESPAKIGGVIRKHQLGIPLPSAPEDKPAAAPAAEPKPQEPMQ